MLHQFRASDQVELTYYDSGHGRLVLFQHGFAMDHHQVLEVWPELQNIRLVCLDTRGHGLSHLGEPTSLSFQRAVQDIRELITHLGEVPTIIGGISLGAALTMELTRNVEIAHLIIARPAFAADGDTRHFAVFRALQHILKTEPQDRWALCLEQQPEFEALALIAPRNQETYRRLLEHPRLDELMIWMDALETEALTLTPAELSQLKCKTDVLAQQDDALHPAHLAETFAELIPEAQIHFMESGSSSDEAYRESMQKTLKAVFTR